MLERQTDSIKRAALINMGSKYAAAAVQLLYYILLARILVPDDFGLVAIAQVFVVFFGLFADMGLGSAVVQRQDLEEQDISRLFSFSVLFGLGLAALFAMAGLPISVVYGQESLLGICIALSPSVFLATLNTVPSSLLLKQKMFFLVGARQIVSTFVASALGLIAASCGIGYWAIVIYSIISNLIIFLWNYISNRIPMMFSGMTGAVRKVFNYSAYLLGFNFFTYFTRNLDNLLVGYFFGTSILGNYSKAYQLAQYPQTYLTGVVTPVLHPILAEHQKEIDYLYSTFIKTAKILSLLGVFVSVFCFFSAKEIVIIVYGGQWLDAVPCFQLLSISIWAQMVCGSSGTMFLVLNRTKEQFIRGILISLIVAGGVLLGVYLGSAQAVAGCVGIAYCSTFVLLGPFLIRRSFNKPICSFLESFLPDLVLAICLVGFFLLLNLATFESIYLSFAVKFFGGVLVYAILLVSLRQVKWFAQILPGRFKSVMPSWMLR